MAVAEPGARARQRQDNRSLYCRTRRKHLSGALFEGLFEESRRCRRCLKGPMKAVAHPSPTSSKAPIEKITGEFLDRTRGDERARRISRRYLPSREAIVEILESVTRYDDPGYFGRRDLAARIWAAWGAFRWPCLRPS